MGALHADSSALITRTYLPLGSRLKLAIEILYLEFNRKFIHSRNQTKFNLK